MRTFIAILILVLIILGIVFIAGYGEKTENFLVGTTSKDNENGDISFLILGRVAEGQGGQWHAAPNLVDAILLVNYKQSEGIVNLVSLPRDLYGEFGGESFKINEIYSRKKIDDFIAKLPEITGIEAPNYIVVDAGLIKSAIDLLGGVDVNLEDPVIDSVTGYRLEPGEHHLTGEDAIWVMRNRFAPEGDFFREKNQHSIIEAMFRKFSSLSTADKTKFLLGVIPYTTNTEKNFSIGELAPKIRNTKSEVEFNGVTLDFTTGLLVSSYIEIGGSGTITQESSTTPDDSATSTASSSTISNLRAYILIPKDGKDEYSSIREFIEGKLK